MALRRKQIGFVHGQENLFSGEFDTGWRPPQDLPDLTRASFIGLDVESHDPTLRSQGPGFFRNTQRRPDTGAHVVGVTAIAEMRDGTRLGGYYPIRHLRGNNFDEGQIFRWLSDGLKTDVPKVGANLPYDLEALFFEGVEVKGPIFDIQNAEGLIDEESAMVKDVKHRGFALEKLGHKYCGRGKDESAMRRCVQLLGTKDIKGHLRMLAPYMGPGEYADEDGHLSLDVFHRQQVEIDRQGLGDIWKLECDIVPILMKMRYKGVRIDMQAAQRAHEEFSAEYKRIKRDLQNLAGFPVDPWKPDDVAKLCDGIGVHYYLTATGKPSVTKGWLEKQKDPALKLVQEGRTIDKMDRDFIVGVLLESSVNGRIHAQFHQLKRSNSEDEDDDSGTRSGRFSSSNPNLQQIPKRDKKFAPLIRACFLPEEGAIHACADYSSQEPRITVHYAAVMADKGLLSHPAVQAAYAMLARYIAVPETDYHQATADMCSVDRDRAKPINLMLTYAAGKKKLAWALGFLTEQEFLDHDVKVPQAAEDLFAKYHAGMPFVQEMLNYADRMAKRRGTIKTILGRLRHFDLWVPKWDASRRMKPEPLPLAMARDAWPGTALVRADTRKALNALIQGSAADMGKKALRDLASTGIIPAILVHDEFDVSVDGSKMLKTVHDCMRDAVPLISKTGRMPILVGMGVGNNWGEANADAKFEEKNPGKSLGARMLAEAA